MDATFMKNKNWMLRIGSMLVIIPLVLFISRYNEHKKPELVPAYGPDESGKTVKTYSELEKLKQEQLQLWDQKGAGIHEREVSPGKGGLIYKNGSSTPFTGIVHKTHSNGVLKGRYSLVDGKMDGGFITYLPDGKVEVIGNYKNGKLNGLLVSYSKNFVEWLVDSRVEKLTQYDKNWKKKKEKKPRSNSKSFFDLFNFL